MQMLSHDDDWGFIGAVALWLVLSARLRILISSELSIVAHLISVKGIGLFLRHVP